MSGLKLWMFGLLPSLLANAETWTDISPTSIQSLEDIQYLLLQRIFNVPRTTPHAALRWDTATISIEMQIAKRKMLFLHHLINLDENSLAKEIFDVQQADNLPGLVSECKALIKQLKLPNIFEKKVSCGLSKLSWKRLVNHAVCDYEQSNLKEIICEKSKLKDGHLSS